MCLIGLKLIQSVPGEARLVVAANRDEFHDRPALPAHWWDSHPDLYAGRDLSAGGTWLGISRSGRFAALTNVRSAQTINAGPSGKSRGQLPVEFLSGNQTAKDYCHSLASRGARYGGFNLLAFDGCELWWCSNQSLPARQISQGVHGLSNASLNSPWPKAEMIRQALNDSLQPDALLAALTSQHVPAGPLPDTGVGPELERQLAPAFIKGPNYGTRCSTILTLGPGGAEMLEVSYDRQGAELQREKLTLGVCAVETFAGENSRSV